MESIRCLILLMCTLCISAASEKLCSDLSGKWYNELGSMMVLHHHFGGELSGMYYTAVEVSNGDAGAPGPPIYGMCPYGKPGAVFGFSVMWSEGSSLTSWTGQCLSCLDGEEILETSWILKDKVNSCGDIWKSTLIGQDTFYRNASQAIARRKRDVSTDKFLNSSQGLSSDIENIPRQACGPLTGHWYNQVGSEMIIHTHNSNEIKGEYFTAVERCEGAAGSGATQVYGVSNSADPNSTVSLIVVWNNGESVTGWAGQCHVCKENGEETLVLTWLLRSSIASCQDNWLTTNYGETTFTRYDQLSGSSLRGSKHLPSESGEKPSGASVTCAGDIVDRQAFLLFLTCPLSFIIAKYFQ